VTVRRSGLLLAAALAAAFLAGCSRRPPSNVIFILVDTLRADRVGTYGSKDAAATPAMDRLAGESIVFERAYAPSSWTLPSVASLFLGQRPYTHGVLQFSTRAPHGGTTLAETFASAGYTTAAFVANQALNGWPDAPRGFATFELLTGQDPQFGAFAYAQAPMLTDRALAWLDTRPAAEGPLFLYLHFMDPHAPYYPHERFTAARHPDLTLDDHALTLRPLVGAGQTNDAARRAFWRLPPKDLARLRQLYDGNVAYLDHSLGRLLSGLEERGILRDAIVILTSDHGEALGEHGLFGHGMTLFESETRIPLIVKLPNTRPRRVQTPVETTGLGVGLLQFLDIDVPSTFTAAPLELSDHSDREPAVSELAPMRKLPIAFHRRVIVDGNRKAYENTKGAFFVTDLLRDPREEALVPPAAPEEHALVAALELLARHTPRQASRQSVPLAPETQRALEALGYVVSDPPPPNVGTP
jgi:arylsulfatase A-like enzyme